LLVRVRALLLLLLLAALPGRGDETDAGGSQQVVAKVLEEARVGWDSRLFVPAGEHVAA